MNEYQKLLNGIHKTFGVASRMMLESFQAIANQLEEISKGYGKYNKFDIALIKMGAMDYKGNSIDEKEKEDE